MKNSNNYAKRMDSSKHLRAIEVRYLGPTNHRGSRVKLVDKRMGQTKTLGYNYEATLLVQAWEWLKEKGFNPIYWSNHYDIDLILCDDWKNFHELKDF